MVSGKRVLHLPVVALSRGATVGSVRDLVIDLDSRAVAALLLSDRTPTSPARLVPFEAIHRVGPHAVTIEDESAVVAASEHPRLQALLDSPLNVVGMKLLTEEGRLLGRVSDLLMDDSSGAIEQYEVSGGALQDLLGGRRYVSATAPRAVGDEFIVVPEASVLDRRLREEDLPLVLETPPWFEAEAEELEQVAAQLMMQQEDLVVGMRARKTVANEDAGGVIVFEGETITEESVQKAKTAGKLNQLIDAAGEAATAALSSGLAEQYAEVAVGRMAGRTVRSTGGEVIVSQGDAVTREVLRRVRQAGVLDQLMESVRVPAGEAAGRAARRRAAGSLWDQVSERVGWLTGRR